MSLDQLHLWNNYLTEWINLYLQNIRDILDYFIILPGKSPVNIIIEISNIHWQIYRVYENNNQNPP